MDICQTLTLNHIESQLDHEDSVDDWLEATSNLIPLCKDSLSHSSKRLHGITYPLTRIDQFLVGPLTSFIHLPPYLRTPCTWLNVMNEYEPKYGLVCTRNHGDLRSKDHMHNFYSGIYLLTSSKTSIRYSQCRSVRWTHILMSTLILVLVSLHKWLWDQPPSSTEHT